MEEMTNNSVEMEQTSDSFMEGWDDTEAFDDADQHEEEVEETALEEVEEAADGAGEAADNNAAEAEEKAAEPVEEAEQKVDAPKLWTLRHMGEAKSVGETEMVTLAQKGMDYDRIRSKYDEAKPVMEMFSQFAKQAGMSVSEYVSHIRLQAKQSEGMSEAEARRAVDLEDREAVVAAKEQQHQAENTQTEEQTRRMAEIEAFRKIYPDAAKDPKGIPAEVWESVRGGMSLVTAYAIYDAKQARAAQAAAEQKAVATTQNQSNAARSTGSMKGAGENTKSRDPFLDGWDS